MVTRNIYTSSQCFAVFSIIITVAAGDFDVVIITSCVSLMCPELGTRWYTDINSDPSAKGTMSQSQHKALALLCAAFSK